MEMDICPFPSISPKKFLEIKSLKYFEKKKNNFFEIPNSENFSK
jgi:hypothetical protein